MERSEDDQWSWWQQNPDEPLPTSDSWVDNQSESPTFADDEAAATPADGTDDPIRKALIGLVAVLFLGLAGVSYQRWGTGASPAAVAASTTSAATQVVNQPTTALLATTAPTTIPSTSGPTTTTSTPPSTTTTVANSGPPGAPLEVRVVSTGRSSAEIRWRSDECVGSRYQVGEFQPGGGGYPDVNRCWFNHVILAGDPAFSPPLEPNTTYTVRIEAIGQDGSISEPAEVQFTTSQ